MKKCFIIICVFFFLISCCDIICKRKKHAELIIEKVELYKNKTGLLPENLQQIGLDDTHMDLSFYEKKNQLEYEVWYGLDLGTSMIYNSKTKKWRKEG